MNKEAQRIVIAEACGWTKCQPDQHYGHDRPRGLKPDGTWEWLPDYLSDLNAMREAQKILRNAHAPEYAQILGEMIHPDPYMNDNYRVWIGAHATAAQKAEAFLRTLNLWEESDVAA